jgi:hypothetical protein
MSLKKVALTAITVIFSVTAFAQNNQNGTLVTAPIRPFAVQDTFPTAWANEIRGGPFTYTNFSDLTNIPVSRLVVGSIGYVSSENKYYRLTSTNPISWTNFETAVTRSSLGFNTTLDSLWTASNAALARSAIGLSTNLDTFWTATNAADARAALQITNTSGGGGGTVTSVALALPGIFSVAGSPITTNGTFNISLVSQNQRLFLASPSGSAGTPSFRAITTSDIPTLNQNTTGTASNVTGIVAISNGGTGATNVESARNNLGFNSNLNSLWTATSVSNARVALDAAKLSMNVVGPFESVNNFLNPANTTIQNETLIRVGVAEQVNQSAQFGYRVIGTDSNGVVGRAVFSVYGFDALMQVGSGAQSGTNFETEVFAGGGTNNKVMTLIKNSTGHMEMDRPISFSTTTHAANTRTNLGFNSSLNAFWTASNTTAAVAALGIGSSGTSTVTRESLGFNATLDSLWTATNAEAARNALQLSNVATNITRSSLGFSTNLDTLWTATNQSGARSGIGLSTNLNSFWTSTSVEQARTNLGLGATWLTNNNVDAFNTALGLGSSNVAYFAEVAVGRAVDLFTISGTASQSSPNSGIAFTKAGIKFLEFSNINGSGVINIIGDGNGIVATSAITRANIRSNLNLGWSGLTNTSAESFRQALGLSTNLNNFWTSTSTSTALNSLFNSSGLTTINSGKTRFNSSMSDNDVLELSHSQSGAQLDVVMGDQFLAAGTYVANPVGSIGVGGGMFGIKYGTNNEDWGYPILLAPNRPNDPIISENGSSTTVKIRSALGFSTNIASLWNATSQVEARDALGITATGSTNTRETLGFSTNLDTFWTATNFADARAALGIDTNNLTTRASLGLATNDAVQFSNLFLSQTPSSSTYTLSFGSPSTGFRGVGAGTNDWMFAINGVEYFGLYQSNVTLGNAGIQTRIMSPMTFFYGTLSGGSSNTGYIAFGGTAPATGAAISRTNLGLGAPWLTNVNQQNFRTAIGFNPALGSLWLANSPDNALSSIGGVKNKTEYILTADQNDYPFTNSATPFIKQLSADDLPKKLALLNDDAIHEYIEIQLPTNQDMLNQVANTTIQSYTLIVQPQGLQNTVDSNVSFRVRTGEGVLITGWLTAYGEDNYAPVYEFKWNGFGGWTRSGPGYTGYEVAHSTTAADARAAMGLTLPALTNVSIANFRNAIGLGTTNIPTFRGITISNTNEYTPSLSVTGPYGTGFQIRLTDESLENGGYPAPRGSIGVDWQATNNFKVKYGDADTDWGSVLYLDKNGDGTIARNLIGLSASWLTNTDQIQFAEGANIQPQVAYLSLSVGGGTGPNPTFPVTNNVQAQRNIRYTLSIYPGWIGTNASGQNIFQNSNNNVRLVLPRSLDGSKRGDTFILTSQFTGAGTNFVSRYGHTYSTNYTTSLVDIEVITNNKANVGFINHDGFNWRRLRAADLGLPDVVEWVTPPAATNSIGTPGQAAYSDNYLYICISNNTWRRATLATW